MGLALHNIEVWQQLHARLRTVKVLDTGTRSKDLLIPNSTRGRPNSLFSPYTW